MSLRDKIRSEIFSSENRKQKTKIIPFYGAKIEVRQPLVAQIVNSDEETGRAALIENLLKYAFVPHTDEKVFDEADVDSLMTMPFSKDFSNFVEAFQELTNIEIREAEGNSEETT